MTARELIEELEYAMEMNDGEDVEVRIAQQPKWPFEYTLNSATTVDMEGGPESEKVVYLEEGVQIGYLPQEAKDALDWSE